MCLMTNHSRVVHDFRQFPSALCHVFMEQTYPGWEGGASVVVADVGVAKDFCALAVNQNTPKPLLYLK